MTAVTGPPAELAERREELTPMLGQYVDRCAEYDDALLLFRVGDFYKSFCEAAETVARVCELTLIEREDSTGTYAAAGIPVENAPKYLERLLEAGYRLAIADQVEHPDEADGLVDRAVTQVITPGTVVDDELLGAAASNYVACVVRGNDGADEGTGGDRHGVARVDVSTGECAVTSVPDRAAVAEELDRVDPAELLLGPGVDAAGDGDADDYGEAGDGEADDEGTNEDAGAAPFGRDCMVTEFETDAFEADAARERLAPYVSNPEAVLDNDAERRAAGAALAYAEYTQGDNGPLSYVARVRRYDARDALRLDAAARRGLELFENRGSASGLTVRDALDETACALGRRELDRWLRRPLVDRERIAARHDAVADLVDRPLVRAELRELLADVYDLERLVGRVSRGRANARDLQALRATLDVVPDLREALAEAEADRLVALRGTLDDLADVRGLVERAIRPDPPQELTEGGVIHEGFDEELDRLRSTEREGREWVADLQASERERTGIDTLEVGHNQVHGYYIEVTNANLDRVPEDYTRRQTLKNAERFYTPELKRREDEIFGAAERADKLEYELFTEVRDGVAAEADRVQAVAEAVAELDVLASFAAVAVERDYVRPELDADGVHIERGRHPVVERTRESFVPNDARHPRGSVAVITGPNMSGKSTYMRQVAVAVVLAQAGSFVPADAARLPVVDRVFTRVGASDDIAGGQSTFMREMTELTTILHEATPDSLVLLDEVGRGTSTADGRAIARATAEFVHDAVGATTLFATHYHDLTALADEREGVFNLHFGATRDGDSGGVTFHHRIREGAASSSYGVEVARMAGVPDAVVARSRDLVAAEDDGDPDLDAAGDAAGAGPRDAAGANDPQRTLADAVATGGDGAAADDGVTAGDGATAADPATNGGGRVGGDGGGDGSGAGERTAPADGDPPTDDGHPADDDLRAVAAELRALDVADTTPLEALTLLNDLRTRLDRP